MDKPTTTATVLSAFVLEELARVQRDKVLAANRKHFDLRWGFFWKCTHCGGRIEQIHDAIYMDCCRDPHYVRAGYTLRPTGPVEAAVEPNHR